MATEAEFLKALRKLLHDAVNDLQSLVGYIEILKLGEVTAATEGLSSNTATLLEDFRAVRASVRAREDEIHDEAAGWSLSRNR